MSSLGKDSITCHVLDTTAGRPAKGISVQLEGPITSSSFSSSATPHPPNQAPPSDAEPIATAAAAAVGPSAQIFEATTDDDGRIRLWKPLKGADGGQQSLPTLLAGVHGASRWMLRFDTASYFGEEKTFFPEATVVFRVEGGQTYHVPLLLSPYSYTTYRGS